MSCDEIVFEHPIHSVLRAGLVILLILFWGSPASHAQAGFEQALRFDRLTQADGLSQGEITDILQDQRGFLWFATNYGLNRYDGHVIQVYTPIPFDTTSLSDGVINDIHEDRSGVIWVGTHYGGLNRFDPATERAVHYLHDPDDPQSLSAGGVTAVFQDQSGMIWVGTEDGLNRMDPDRPGQFTRYRHEAGDPFSLSHDLIRSIAGDEAGNLWIATADGLNRMELQAPGRFERFLHRSGESEMQRSLYRQYTSPDEPHIRWIGSDDGLIRLDATDGHVERFFPNPDRSPGNNVVYTVSSDPGQSGVLWVSMMDQGIARFDTETQTFTRYHSDHDDAYGLVEHTGSFVFTDRSGIIWVGSLGSGLNKFDPVGVGFGYYGAVSPTALPGTVGLRAPLVWGLYVTRDGAVWVGTDGFYLHRIDPVTGVPRVWEAHPEGALNPNQPAGEPNAFAENPDGTLWIGTTHGLDRYDPATDRFTHFRHDPNDFGSISNDNILALSHDAAGVLWIGTGDGLNRFDERTETFTHYRHDPADPNSLDDDWVTAILEDQAGRLWVATNAGVSRLDRTTGHFNNYWHDPNDTTTLTSGTFGWLHERPREPGILWIGGLGGGLDRLDTHTGIVTHYTNRTSEMPDNTVYAILEDENGRLWLSTNRGLVRFDPDEPVVDRAFRRFGLESGLQSLEFNQHAAYRAPNGRFYFGGVRGITTFRPEETEGNTAPPLVALTDLRVSNPSLSVGSGSSLRQVMAGTDNIHLPFDQRNVAFEFVALHFKSPLQNRYRYRLDGFDADWVEAGTQRTASYTNLEPGTYTFEVTAANSDGFWNEEPRRIRLTILPPWWRTTWAYLTYGLVFLGGAFVVDRVQRRRLIRRERERTRERELEQAREIERAYHELRETKDRLVQQEKLASLGQVTAGIAHEIKNPLNFINNFAELNEELAQELRETYEADPDLQRANVLDLISDLEQNAATISQHGKRADRIVRAMMHHASGGAGQRTTTPLNPLVSEYIDLAYHGKRIQVSDLNVAIRKDLSEVVGTVDLMPQEIGRVLLNLLGNAFDAVHARAASDDGAYVPTVTVSTRNVNDQVEIRVSDNGVGIPEEVRAKVFEPFFTTKPTGLGTGLGLSLSHEIVTQGHGGTLTVESQEGEGATFIVRLPASS